MPEPDARERKRAYSPATPPTNPSPPRPPRRSKRLLVWDQDAADLEFGRKARQLLSTGVGAVELAEALRLECAAQARRGGGPDLGIGDHPEYMAPDNDDFGTICLDYSLEVGTFFHMHFDTGSALLYIDRHQGVIDPDMDDAMLTCMCAPPARTCQVWVDHNPVVKELVELVKTRMREMGRGEYIVE